MDKKNILINELIEIYRDIESDYFIVGNIIRANENFILYKNFELDGSEAGFGVLLIENILLIKYDTKYLNRIKKLSKSPFTNEIKIPKLKEDYILDTLKYANENNEIIGIELSNSKNLDLLGKINSINEGIIKIVLYDENGEYNGISIVEINAISSVIVRSQECLELYKLINSFDKE